MKTKTLAIGLVLILLASSVYASGYSPRTHFYAVEFLKGTDGVSIINVTLNRQLDPQTAERILREEIQRAVTLFPSKDIMAYAWSETEPQPGSEKMIALPDGSSFLISTSETAGTLTEKQYSVLKQKSPEPGKVIKVDFTLKANKGGDGRIRFVAKTNLPDGMTLMLHLQGVGVRYFSDDKVDVANGEITSSWFSDNGKPLPAGIYELHISSPLPDFQPPAVRSVIGKNGENLTGPIESLMGSTMVN